MALGVLACDGGGDPKAERPAESLPAATMAVSASDLDRYAMGTRAQIDELRRAIRSGHPADRWQIDSTAAAAARVSVEEFQAIQAAVDAALKTRETLANRAAGLDSLRIELLVLRVRAETQP